ncbi:hypothetical protein P2318_19815 [Myxococcaceae bacterium GXIMD 01537]
MRLLSALIVLCFLLGGTALAAPPAKAPVPPQRVLLPLAISILDSDLSTNTWLASKRPVTNFVALGLVNGGAELYGLGVALGGNSYEEETRGVLLAGVANTVFADAAGLQVAGLVNTAEGRFSGLQLTPGTNVAQSGMWGLQVSGFGNATDHLSGIQAALLGMNFSDEDVRGAQLSGLGANDAEDVFGLQISGIGNSTRTLAGVQVALFGNAAFAGMTGLQVSLLNLGGDVKGAQVGLINIADTVRGTQLGLLNFSNAMKGFPLGLVSFEEGAPFHVETWASDIQLINVAVKFGGKSTYTTVLAGVGPDDRLQRYTLGLGLGGHVRLSRLFWLDLDVTGSVVRQRGQALLDGANVLAQGRLMFGFQLFEHLALFAGPTYNTYFSWSDEDRQAPTTQPVRVYQVDPDITLQHWPGLQVGLRI